MTSPDLAGQEAALVARRQPFARVTVVWSASPVSAKAGDTALVTPDGRLQGWVGGSCSEPVIVRQALESLADRQPRLVRLDPPGVDVPAREGVFTAPVTCASGGSLEVFVEPRLAAPHLVVVGRSPLARALTGMAALIGFDVAVVEREGADAAEFAPARVIGELDLDKAGVGSDSFVVVATMGRYDEDAVEAALRSGASYVALVASARRAAAVRDALAATVDPEDLARVRAPAGLDLGPLPHAEIAVAVLAELVAHKAASAPAAVAADTAPTQPPGVDPVCGMTVDPASAADSAVVDGVTYWFCCAGCRRRFEGDPQRYLAAAP